MRKFPPLVVACLLTGLLAIPSLSLAKTKAKPKSKAAATAAASKKKAAKTAPAAAKAADPKAAETKPAETKTAEAKAAETKPAEAKPATGGSAGEDLFLAQKCTKCHKVSAEGIAPVKEKDGIVDLSGVGGEHEAAWFKQWLNKEIDKNSLAKTVKVKHKGSWKGTEAELDTIAAWLKGLTKKAK